MKITAINRKGTLRVVLVVLALAVLAQVCTADLESYDCETASKGCSSQGTCTDFGYCICDDGFLGFDCSGSKF